MINEEQMKIEQNHLQDVYKQICAEIEEAKIRIEQAELALKEHYLYKDESIYDMDVEEETSTDLFFENLKLAIDVCKKRLSLLEILKKSCFFGSFKFTSATGFNNVYVGKTGFIGHNAYPLVCDWRAPISSLFYNYEIGEAEYICEDGKISGEILSKSQYKVAEDEIIYAFDSSLTISDEILKRELASSQNGKMKDIVSTIQKEQNLIIRNPDFKNMLIQGVAGSGKTSIALHRAAYLLYSMRDELKSENILVISNSEMFSKYIENVLPELGEHSINSKTFIDIAHEQLNGFYFETNYELSERLLKDKNSLKDYIYKNSFEFKDEFKKFIEEYQNKVFMANDIKFGEEIFSANEINKLYSITYKNLTPAEKLQNICDVICEQLNIPNQARFRVLNQLYSMFNFSNLFDILIEFYKNNEKILNKLEKIYKNNKILIKNDDLILILYLTNYFYGFDKHNGVKLLIVDEFQEYSPLHFEFLKQIYDCNWIILGDINQSIFKNLDDNYLQNLSKQYNLGEIIYLNKSYRMTNQISEFANSVKKIDGINFDRDGEQVDFIENKNLIEVIKNSRFNTKAILCKDEITAFELYNKFKNEIDCSLNKFENDKILIANINSVKGIEFDEVIIPNFENFDKSNKIDVNILYNIITRATNKLIVIKG